MPSTRAQRPSLVELAEEALRNWLAPGRHRTGDRLPPEHDLAAMLGVSRGTLRAALERLEQTGEIVRRQGSGTFVGQMAPATPLGNGPERLGTYMQLARSRGIALTAEQIVLGASAVEAQVAEVLDVQPGTVVRTIARVLYAEGVPAATMFDYIHPSVTLPPDDELRAALARGDMTMDVLIDSGQPMAYVSTRVLPRLLMPGDRAADDLWLTEPTAVLELEEAFHVASGTVAQYSTDMFSPGGHDLHVIRWTEAHRPAQVTSSAGGHRGHHGPIAPRD